jgi:hypothetical protein
MFCSKIEAYSFCLLFLERQKRDFVDNMEAQRIVDDTSANIRVAIENHETNPGQVSRLLDDFAKKVQLSDESLKQLPKLQLWLQNSSYEQTLEQRFTNPLPRRWESHFAIELLLNPTHGMMNAVGEVSKGVVAVCEDLIETPEDVSKEYLNIFLGNLKESVNATGLGAFEEKATIEEVISVLNKNHPEQLPTIMLIHFEFALRAMRDVPIRTMRTAPLPKPVGKLLDLIQAKFEFEQPEQFFEFKEEEQQEFISDTCFLSGCSLFSDKGREGLMDVSPYNESNQLGLLTTPQRRDATGLPTHGFPWVPDARGQLPNYESAFVKFLLEHEVPYISGVSGMISLLLGLMENLAGFSAITVKQLYLQTACAYIVGGGFHSLYEVITPAQLVLNLIPGYQMTSLTEDKDKLPPNYHQFFVQQTEVDPEFAERLAATWQNYLAYYQQVYLESRPAVYELAQEFKLVNSSAQDAALFEVINQAIDNFIGEAPAESITPNLFAGSNKKRARAEKLRELCKGKKFVEILQCVKNFFDIEQWVECPYRDKANFESSFSAKLSEQLIDTPDVVALMNLYSSGDILLSLTSIQTPQRKSQKVDLSSFFEDSDNESDDEKSEGGVNLSGYTPSQCVRMFFDKSEFNPITVIEQQTLRK